MISKFELKVVISLRGRQSITRILNALTRVSDCNLRSVVVAISAESDWSKDCDRVISYAQSDSKVVGVLLPRQKYFNKSIMSNIGSRFGRGSHVLFLDADVVLTRRFYLSLVRRLRADSRCLCFGPKYVRETSTGILRDAPGIIAVSMEALEGIDGFDSSFMGWGFEDHDFESRLRISGSRLLREGELLHISHTEESRTENYCEKDRMRSRNQNLVYYQKKAAGPVLGGTRRMDCDQHLDKCIIITESRQNAKLNSRTGFRHIDQPMGTE